MNTIAPPAAHDGATPEDLRFPAGFEPASVDELIRLARHLVHAYRAQNEPRTQRTRGDWSLHPITYARELHTRKSLLYRLLQLKSQQQEKPA